MSVNDPAMVPEGAGGACGPEGVEILVQVDAPEDWPARAGLEEVARRAAGAAWREGGGGPGRVSITLSDDDAVRDLNRRWRGRDAPTNVLSFPAPPMPAPPGEAPFLGDLVLAGGVVAREAREAGVPLGEHLAWLVIHGILHLLGHDHLREEERRRMEELECRALRRLGMESPY